MTEACSFGIQLNSKCHKLDYGRLIGIENLADLEKTEVETLLWRAELQDKESEMSIWSTGSVVVWAHLQ